jgi:dihydroorotase
MTDLSRRWFVRATGLAAAIPILPTFAQTREALASSQTSTGYDLLIANGRVIDPGRKLDAVMDVAVANGKIAKVGADIPRSQAREVFDASGKLVTPGLIDMHGHVYDGVASLSIDPDAVGIPKSVTTIVDCGSSGATTFPGFRKYIVERAHTKVFALLNISKVGLVVMNELYSDPALIDPQAAIAIIRETRDVIVGIKIRIRGRDEDVAHDIDALKKTREASDETGVPVMMHWTNEPRLLAMLKKGDILVHPFNPPASGPSLLGADGKVLPQILELKSRGIFTDFAHGNHLKWETAEAAAKQGWFPDTISTDIHRAHVGPTATVQDLVTTISKFLYLGLPLNDALEKVTSNPARILALGAIGSLQEGNIADLSILDVEKGNFELLDSLHQKRTGHQKIVPVATIRAGKLSHAS